MGWGQYIYSNIKVMIYKENTTYRLYFDTK